MSTFDKESLVEEAQRLFDAVLTPKEQKEMRNTIEEDIDKKLDIFFLEKCFYMLDKLHDVQKEINKIIELIERYIKNCEN